MNNVLSRKIIKDLEKVGFPAEVAVATDLEKDNWIVYNGALFVDDVGGKPREIDVRAVDVDFSLANQVKRKIKKGTENKLISHLIIEVKKTDKPWVFFDNGRPNDWAHIPEQNIKASKKDFPTFFDELKSLGLKRHRYLNAKFHKSYHVAFTKPLENSMIYESLIKTSKALIYFKDIYGIGGFSIHLFTPIIVLDGSLWSATLDKNNIVKLKSVDHLFVLFGQLTTAKTQKITYEDNQVLDVVTRKSFMKYLKTIRKDNKEIYKAWTNWVK